MKTEKKDYVAFWSGLGKQLDNGIPLLRSLKGLAAGAKGKKLGPVIAALAQAIEGGATFSEALRTQAAAFSPCVINLARAGEAGGVLEVICRRIAEGVDNGTLLLPGEKGNAKSEMARAWRTFGLLISSGVPILQALELAGDVVSGRKPAEGFATLRQAVLDGRGLAETVRDLPDVFPPQIVGALDVGERTGSLEKQVALVAEAMESGNFASLPGPEESRPETAEASPVIRAVDRMIIEAMRARASDIHLVPIEGGKGQLRYRVDGVLRKIPMPELTDRFGAVVTRLKIMANLNVAEKRLPQDGRIRARVMDREIDLRVNVTPVVFGERMVIRILDAQSLVLALNDIVTDPGDLARLQALCRLPHGIVICSGPTGSGKTTLLYAMLNEMDRESRCVLTIEDPVEYRIEDTGQIAIAPAIGLTFGAALRSVLRQDPDVIMVGEIRDAEVAQICVQASLTGHLVLTTLHAGTAIGAVRRLVDIGLAPFLINSAVSGVVAQRLLRRLCPECRERTDVPASCLPPEGRAVIEAMDSAQFYRPKGCARCAHTGYRGRMAIHEILVMGEKVRRLVHPAPLDMRALEAAAREEGMKTLTQSGMIKAAQGLTSIEEVLRVAPPGAEL